MPSGLIGILNRLLPFATPGTPLVQDLLHLAALCLLLYLAPQIQETLQRCRGVPGPAHHGTADDFAGPENHENARETDEELPEDDVVREDPREAGVPQQERAPDVEPPQDGQFEEGQPGPAQIPNTAANRNVGAKKAKSLARRDQRRAYHEFMRSQGDAQRARDAEGAAERDAAMTAEKERRKAAEVALEAKKAKERDERKAKEEQERLVEIKRRELAVNIVKDELNARNMCDLFKVAERVGDDVDEVWVEKLLKTAGFIGLKGNAMTVVTSTGWVVRVTEEQMANMYIAATENGIGDSNGRVEMEELGVVLERMLCT